MQQMQLRKSGHDRPGIRGRIGQLVAVQFNGKKSGSGKLQARSERERLRYGHIGQIRFSEGDRESLYIYLLTS